MKNKDNITPVLDFNRANKNKRYFDSRDNTKLDKSLSKWHVTMQQN